MWIVRGVFAAVFVLMTIYLRPFGLEIAPSFLFGAVFSALIVLLEVQVRQISLRRLIGAAVGAALGILGAFLAGSIIGSSFSPDTAPFFKVAVLLFMAYVGTTVGSAKGEMLNLGALGGLFGGDKTARKAYKILDTSVIIDGRIADVAETGFLDGTIVVPQFVLWELQLVADSSDSMKRNRGRRGLDILQRLQKIADLNVQIVEADFPKIKDVDLKLIELAKDTDGKIVTNDFNLNKVAQVQGVSVLNINELANSLKPIVLPGELMNVFILKEGKEYNQGVAYLDDGTMVVVDNARRMISKTIEISVTSVLQTTAGKMIFGRYDDRNPGPSTASRPPERSNSFHSKDPSSASVGQPQRVQQGAGR